MNERLSAVFGELGISQYLDAFIDQGFDTWDTILDITESDLDALGVKLGHRRKLQRRIANSRGFAPIPLLSPVANPSIEDSRLDPAQRHAHLLKSESEVLIGDGAPTVAAKRKYRRHPKPDENAPERPPSAYVLFSNKMREDLKGRNLSFTEIAKLVGENWQSLPQSAKLPFETQAQNAKDKYNQELAEYKKTPEYQKYLDYLQEFKAKHGNQAPEKDAAKRVRLSESNPSSQSPSGNSSIHRRDRSGSNSASGSDQGSEPPQQRHHRRIESVPSVVGTHAYSTPLLSTADERVGHRGPGSEYSESVNMSPRDATSGSHSRRNSGWTDGRSTEPAYGRRSLPPLSDVFDPRSLANVTPPATEVNGHPGLPMPQPSMPNGFSGPAPTPTPHPPGLVGGRDSRPPPLVKQYSSAGSTSSSFSYPKTPTEGPMPIHALLVGQPASAENGYDFPYPSRSHSLDNPKQRILPDRSGSDPIVSTKALNGVRQPISFVPGLPTTETPHRMQESAAPPPPYPPGARPPAPRNERNTLDGLAALLRAGEIVDRKEP